MEGECGFSSQLSQELVSILYNGPYLILADSYHPVDRYSRHSLFHWLSGADPQEVQERLARSHVVFLGCGGIGNLMSVNLATAGVGQVTLVDSDLIEKSNLTRQYLFIGAESVDPNARF
ncbi:MAG: hypothetical protein CW348_15340 [Thermobifida sp.]|uniref:HesA/MoeB/ThiF family protein n=1 Tax=Thermobifida sp. TaxID=2027107 RepID=UPI0009DBC465|nr:hypothetical protein [Thermobifida sp.]PZN62046.1 MAG: ThiF family adenylyltransferase [Thermobifida fusca]